MQISQFYNDVRFKNSNKKMNDLSEFAVDKAVAVHMTDFLPRDGIILSTRNSYTDKNGLRKSRDTVHFALNHAVTPNSIGFNWNKKPIGIIAPLKGIMNDNPKENIIGGAPNDFYIKKSVKLPEGTVIVRYSKRVPKGKLKVINADTIDAMKSTKGIKVIETSDNVKDITNDCIEKMGYTRLDKLYSEKVGKGESASAVNRMLKANEELKTAWGKMAREEDFEIYQNHQTSPYGRSEFLIESVNILAKNGNKWTSEIKTFNPFTQEDVYTEINYKKEFSNVIDSIKTSLPPKKELSYDIEEFRKNIEESKTPKESLKRLAETQGIKPMDETIGSLKYNNSPEYLYKTIDSIVDLFMS